MDNPKVYDMNVLYDAYLSSMKSSPWKAEPQKFEINLMGNLTALSNEIESKTYQTLPGSEFILNERGKIRHIHGGRMRDRVVRHALCDTIITPALEPYIIQNNFASQKGKGVDYARSTFERHLHNYWLEYRSNDGWVCFLDFSKYYDNIQHEKIKEKVDPLLDDDAAWLFDNIIDNFQIDVSYMSDEEFARCVEEKFNSVQYYETIPNEAHTGQKMIPKSVDIGDQVSQSIGVFFPTEIDTYVTCVRGFKRYGRYMDDMYLIHKDRAYLEETVDGIMELAKKNGLFINEKKTHICRLSDRYTFLQFKYWLDENGKVVKRINPKSVTRQRRRLKAYRRLLDDGRITYDAIEQSYKSWMGRYAKMMSKQQVKNMQELYQKLFDGRNPRWKK